MDMYPGSPWDAKGRANYKISVINNLNLDAFVSIMDSW